MKRREFLKSLAALALAPASPKVAAASAGASPILPAYIGICHSEVGYSTLGWKMTYTARILNDAWLTQYIDARCVS